MKCIFVSEYFCTDWHDWEEWGRYLRTRDCGFDFKDEDPELAIMQDIIDNFEYADENGVLYDAKKLLDKLKGGNETVISDTDYGVVTIERLKDGRIVFTYKSQLEFEATYTIEDIPDEEIEYLPVIQFIRFPKVVAMVERIVGRPEKTYARAERSLRFMNFNREPFEEENKIVLISSKKMRETEWYKANIEMVEKYIDTPCFRDEWHPIIQHHKEACAAVQEKPSDAAQYQRNTQPDLKGQPALNKGGKMQ